MLVVIKVKRRDILRLAADANLHPDTVVRVLQGVKGVRANTIESVRDAALRIGVSLDDVERLKVRAT
jgi:DNA-binding LacI/PurR family transcriptional regulator